MTATSPVIKAEMPDENPSSIGMDNEGLLIRSPSNVSDAGAASYKVFTKIDPMMKNNGIAIISPSDDLPNFVLGMIPPVLCFI